MAAAARVVQGWDDGREQTEALAAAGLKSEIPLGDAPLLLPVDCLYVTHFFMQMTTQTQRAGMEGVFTGLRYEASAAVREAMGVPVEHWPEVFADLRVMELHALELASREK